MGLQLVTTEVGFGIHQVSPISERHFHGWEEAASFLQKAGGTQHSMTERGVVLQALSGVTAADAKRRWHDIPFILQLRWYELMELSFEHPWPEWSIRFRSAGTVDTRHYRPGSGQRALGFGASDGQKARFEEMAESFLATVREHSRAKVKVGWQAHPTVRWERVNDLPSQSLVGEGAFRTAASGPQIVAQREPKNPLQTIWAWFASSPERRWRDTPRELVVTKDSLFARFWNGQAYRLPLAALRERRAHEDSDDAVFVFGRSTHVVLLDTENCPVDAALRRALAAHTA